MSDTDGRVEIGHTDDGERVVILRPKSRFKGDIEAQTVRDAIDDLVDYFLRYGENRIVEELLHVNQEEDEAEGLAVNPVYLMPDDAPLARMAMELQTAPHPMAQQEPPTMRTRR